MTPPPKSDHRDDLNLNKSPAELVAELNLLRDRLREAEETLDAIRNGDVDAVVVSGNDNAPRVYTLQTADESYRLLVQEMQEGALTLTGAGDILYCNNQLAHLVGDEAEKIIAGSLRRFIGKPDWKVVLGMILREDKGEIDLRTESGLSIPVHISFSALRGAPFSDTQVYCAIVTDLTEQRRTSDELRATHDALLMQVTERERTERLLRQSQKMEAVGQLTGGIAHDFNNLLMVIAGGLSILERNPAPERRSKIQDGMRQAAARGAALTRQLLAFSRQKELVPKTIIIPRHVDSMRELLDGSLGGDIDVATQFTPDIWPVQVDEGEFEIALLNLCVNARDAMPKGGTITIAAENCPHFTSLQLSGDYVALSVADTGEGMDADTVSRCLEPFFTTKDIGKGSGLGLAQVYGFVQGSLGTIHIESELGRGTKVTLYLPRATAAVLDRREATGRLQEAASSSRVLLVEDDATVASVTGEMLNELGYEVMHANGAASGLQALAAHGAELSIVLSDVMMPGGISGLSFVQEIRRRNIQLPVVLMSGRAEVVRREAGKAGVTLLAKPFELDELGTAIGAALNSATEPSSALST
jgi:PAS domain S-box-containing protein